jgi:predicted transcriptional regulator YheO
MSEINGNQSIFAYSLISKINDVFRATNLSIYDNDIKEISDYLYTIYKSQDFNYQLTLQQIWGIRGMFAILADIIADKTIINDLNILINEIENKIRVVEHNTYQNQQRNLLINITRVLSFLQMALGSHVEFALYDVIDLELNLSKTAQTYMSVIGNITGRKSGSPITDGGRRFLQEDLDHSIYLTHHQNEDGSVSELISGYVSIRDWLNKRIAILNINIDISKLISYAKDDKIYNLLSISQLKNEIEHFANNPANLVRRILNDIDLDRFSSEHGQDWIRELEKRYYIFSIDFDTACEILSQRLRIPLEAFKYTLEALGIGKKSYAKSVKKLELPPEAS